MFIKTVSKTIFCLMKYNCLEKINYVLFKKLTSSTLNFWNTSANLYNWSVKPKKMLINKKKIHGIQTFSYSVCHGSTKIENYVKWNFTRTFIWLKFHKLKLINLYFIVIKYYNWKSNLNKYSYVHMRNKNNKYQHFWACIDKTTIIVKWTDRLHKTLQNYR